VHSSRRSSSRRFGTSITWLTVKSAKMGKATVYVDGVKKLTVDNYASTTQYGIKRAVKSLANRKHTVKIVVLGTHRRAASGSNIAVDGWLVG